MEKDFGTVGCALALEVKAVSDCTLVLGIRICNYPGYLRSYVNAGSLLDEARAGCIIVCMYGKAVGPLHAGGVAGGPDEGRLVTENDGDGVGGTSKRTCF
jgi:hypothetical protein